MALRIIIRVSGLFPRFAPGKAVLCVLLPAIGLLAQPLAAAQTFQGVLQQGVAAVARGDFPGAFTAFEILRQTFGREPEYRQPAFRGIVLPVHGHAALMSGHPGRAAELFGEFLQEVETSHPRHPLVLYSLALAKEAHGDPSMAMEVYARFAETHPRTAEAPLARLRRIHLLFENEQSETAHDESSRFFQSAAPQTLRLAARLRSLEKRVEEGRTTEALALLLETDWDPVGMPERASLAFAALRVGDSLLLGGDHAAALRAYRIVPPRQQLLKQQAEVVARYRQALPRAGEGSGRMAEVWLGYRREQLQRLETQWRALETMEDYTPGFFLRYGQAYLGNGRPREAWLLFRNLARDPGVDPAIRQQAHFRWILAAHEMEAWGDCLQLAEAFAARYPEASERPDAFFIVASALQQKGRLAEANPILTRLIADHPDHPRLPVWRFTRGMNLSRMEQYAPARTDFRWFREHQPNHPLAARAGLMEALTHHFERDYPVAIASFDDLLERFRGHPMEPEILYRRAASFYGARDSQTARAAVESFLESYPGHALEAEATVLLGDVLMGKGKLARADYVFSRLGVEAGRLHAYAIFQQGKIYRAWEDYDRMETHFREYLSLPAHGPGARLSEALYWTGWALERQGREAEAVPLYLEALERYGNNPAATEILPILRALAALVEKPALRDIAPPEPWTNWIEEERFIDWVEAERTRALEEGGGGLASRLTLFLSEVHRGQGRDPLADAILLEIEGAVAPEKMDPEALARIGLILASRGVDDGERYLQTILDWHPTHPARAYAYLGKAGAALRRNEGERAVHWLDRLDRELPAHPSAAEGLLLRGEVLTREGDFEGGRSAFEELLRLRSARGRPHARALAGLARLEMARNEPERAIAYWQRLYTVYRAYPDLMGEAYVESAVLFHQLGRSETALRSLEEMLAEERLQITAAAERARELRRQWETKRSTRDREEGEAL